MKKKSMKNTYQAIKEGILNQKKPFCLTDIYNRLEEAGISDDRNFINQVLNDLYALGIVRYKCVRNGKEPMWAFVVT